MDDKPIEIRDDEINVEAIMAKIRENIRCRQAAGELPPDTPSPSSFNNYEGSATSDPFQPDLSYLQTYWDIQNNSYFISSHRPYIGQILTKGRRLVHGEVRRYADPIIYKQGCFNKHIAEILTNLVNDNKQLHGAISTIIKTQDTEISQLKSRTDATDKSLQSLITSYSDIEQKMHTDIQSTAAAISADIERKMHADIQNATAAINADIERKMHADFQNATAAINADIEQKIHLDVQNAVMAINTDIERKTWLAHVLEERISTANVQKTLSENSVGGLGIDYLSFENRFRGSHEDISGRQKKFTQYLVSCTNVLDIGCGRGEFLELLKEQGIGSLGIDIDEHMVEFCRSKGLNVEMADAVTYLSQIKDQSLDGIFIDQVVEHLEPAYLVRLLGLCYQKMKDSYVIVIETVNPLSFVSLANFFIDMTHKRPVHPETLKYLMRSVEFKDIEMQFLSPVPEEARLQYISDVGSDDSEKRQSIVGYNRNIDILNSVLFGPQDYILTGKK